MPRGSQTWTTPEALARGHTNSWRELEPGLFAIIVQVASDTSRVSFLWSYPNMMPLSAGTVRRIAATLAPWRFERVYGAFPGREVLQRGGDAVASSARRYIELLESTQA